MKRLIFGAIALAISFAPQAQQTLSPNGRLAVTVVIDNGTPVYDITLDGKTMLEGSPLGLHTNIGDLSQGLTITTSSESTPIQESYSLPNIKSSQVDKAYNQRIYSVAKDGKKVYDLEFRVSDQDVAYRYLLPSSENPHCLVINSEATGFVLPEGSTTFMCPQMLPMTGFARTAPSYETRYAADEAMGSNGWGDGYVFPCLFRIGDQGWLLISETGVDGSYVASHLENRGGNAYGIAFPNPAELNGLSSSAAGVTLPGTTPWRTITVGETLAPIMESTVANDLVQPKYAASKVYPYGKGTWSWIIRMDGSCNYDEQKEYIDFAADLGYQTVLVDAHWDSTIGHDRIAELADYGKSKGVDLFLWYNSNGYWNDAPQGPRGYMDNSHRRRQEMAWMKDTGIRGIKVDFFGGDKQQVMQLYEDILSDANDFGIECIFHGCTLPRGWERMYPNFVSAEAVRASENLYFGQDECDHEAFSATFLPVTRNAVASMDFGGSALNKYYHQSNQPGRGNVRRTSDVFALATATMFQSPVQHFALAPNNLIDAPEWAIDFMKSVPTTWDEVKFIDGYPGKYMIMARRHGDTWYVSGINAEPETLKTKLDLSWLGEGEAVIYRDDHNLVGEKTSIKIKKNKPTAVEIPTNGAFLIVK